MFQFKKNKSQNTAAASIVDQDFIVHNMPVASRRSADLSLTPTPNNPSRESTGFIPTAVKNNSKTVGLVIILGGFLLVSGFVYLSFRFIVKPTAGLKTAVQTATSTNNQTEVEPPVATSSASSDEVSVTTTSELATVTPEIISNATSTDANLNSGDEPSRLNTGDLPPVLDTDSDGLSDDEEAVFGTLTTSADSDSDGFTDLVEIQKGYDPTSNGKLSANPSLTKYSNAAFQYETIVPKSWPSQALNSEATIIFTAPDESLLQISVQDNSDQASILTWYSQSFPDSLVTYDKLKSTDYYDGIMGEGGLNFYLTDKNRRHIFVISYIPAVNNRLAYPNVFKLLIDSLVIK